MNALSQHVSYCHTAISPRKSLLQGLLLKVLPAQIFVQINYCNGTLICYLTDGLVPKKVRSNEMLYQLITFGNPPMPRAKSSFNEPVDTTAARRDLKKRCKDNIDSLQKSPESRERARCSALSFSVALTSSWSMSQSNSGTSTDKKTFKIQPIRN